MKQRSYLLVIVLLIGINGIALLDERTKKNIQGKILFALDFYRERAWYYYLFFTGQIHPDVTANTYITFDCVTVDPCPFESEQNGATDFSGAASKRGFPWINEGIKPFLHRGNLTERSPISSIGGSNVFFLSSNDILLGTEIMESGLGAYQTWYDRISQSRNRCGDSYENTKRAFHKSKNIGNANAGCQSQPELVVVLYDGSGYIVMNYNASQRPFSEWSLF